MQYIAFAIYRDKKCSALPVTPLLNHCYHCNWHDNNLIRITHVIKIITMYISDNCWYHHYNQNHYANYFTNALWIMYLSKLLCLSSVLLIFSRGLSGLRAAHLNQQVVVVGGCTMGVISVGSNNRDEVLCRIILLSMWNLSCFQVLQYNYEERTWLRIGTLEIGRTFPAIVEANLAAVCAAVGNLYPIQKGNQESGKSSSSSLSPKTSYSMHEHRNP